MGVVTSQIEDFGQTRKHGTHPTTNWGVEVKKNKVGKYSREGCHAGKEVNL